MRPHDVSDLLPVSAETVTGGCSVADSEYEALEGAAVSLT